MLWCTVLCGAALRFFIETVKLLSGLTHRVTRTAHSQYKRQAGKWTCASEHCYIV